VKGCFWFFVACAGGFVLFRALRSDITLSFLASYAALIIGRAFWLGDPWPIVVNQLSSGALLIFAFFMISDPKSTPCTRMGRIIFAALTALVAFAIQFGLYNGNGLLWSLFLCAFSVPLIDRAFSRTPRPIRAREPNLERGQTPAPILTGAGK
jgi:Na+-translocating ferredoxin:NAD+ oxidoreductase RnfD subunit